jgi:hypothetical protein
MWSLGDSAILPPRVRGLGAWTAGIAALAVSIGLLHLNKSSGSLDVRRSLRSQRHVIHTPLRTGPGDLLEGHGSTSQRRDTVQDQSFGRVAAGCASSPVSVRRLSSPFPPIGPPDCAPCFLYGSGLPHDSGVPEFQTK